MSDIEATESVKQRSKPVIADDEDEDLFGEEQEASSEPKQDNDVDDLFGDEDNDEAAEKSNLNNSGDEDDEDEEEDQFLVKTDAEAKHGNSMKKSAQFDIIRHPPKFHEHSETESLPPIYDAKVPSYLKIQPTRFDASNFSKYLESIDLKIDNGQLTQQQLSLIKLREENTIRWRFNKSESAGLEMESNTQLIEWEDGSMSLKLGEEVFDVIQSNLKDTYLMTKQENQTAADGDSAGQFSSAGSENALYLSDGAVVKSFKFVPTSTHSKIHKSLTSALVNPRAQKKAAVQSVFVNIDPSLEGKRLERLEEQKIRERRKETLRLEREQEGTPTPSSQRATYSQRSRPMPRARAQDSYEKEDDFLADDDEDEDPYGYDDEEEEEEEEEEENLDRLNRVKNEGRAKYDSEDEDEDSGIRKKRRVIDDDEDDE